MKNPYLKYCFLMVLAVSLSELRSQEVIPVAGGDVSGDGGLVSFTVGHDFTNTRLGQKEQFRKDFGIVTNNIAL